MIPSAKALSATIILVASLGLSACTTSAYRAASSPMSHGYSDAVLEEGRHRVTFRSRNLMTAYDFALLRAAEITRAQHHEWFHITDTYTHEEERLVSSDFSFGYGHGYGGYYGHHNHHSRHSYGHGYGHSSYYDLGFGYPMTTSRTEATHSIEFVIGSGSKPDDDKVYDASDVIAKIGPRAYPPEKQ